MRQPSSQRNTKKVELYSTQGNHWVKGSVFFVSIYALPALFSPSPLYGAILTRGQLPPRPEAKISNLIESPLSSQPIIIKLNKREILSVACGIQAFEGSVLSRAQILVN